MFLHHHEHKHCSLFWINPTYSVLRPEILEHQMCINLPIPNNYLLKQE